LLPAASRAWRGFSGAALLGIVVLINVGHWYKTHGITRLAHAAGSQASRAPRRHVVLAIAVLLALVFSKYIYLASLTSYYTFYLIDHFHVSCAVRSCCCSCSWPPPRWAAWPAAPWEIGSQQVHHLASILGVLPFTAPLAARESLWTCVLTVPIGLIISSAFPAIVVYAQDLLPGRTGMVAGLFFRTGVRHGQRRRGGARPSSRNHSGIDFVYQVCAFLPLIGLLAAFLPDVHEQHVPRAG